jgi:hypothetical protein
VPQIGVLAAYQQPCDRPRTFLGKDVAREMVRRMVAEQISAKLIRVFPDDSLFTVLKPLRPSDAAYVPAHYPPVEVECCKFVPPLNSTRPTMGAICAGWDWQKEALPAWVMPPRAELFA